MKGVLFYKFFLENFIDGIIGGSDPQKPLYKGGYGREGGGGPPVVGRYTGIYREEYTICEYTPPINNQPMRFPLHYQQEWVQEYRLQIGQML